MAWKAALLVASAGLAHSRAVGFTAPTTHAHLRRADFKQPPQAPVVWNDTVDSIKRDGKALCDRYTATLDKLVAQVTPENATFENVMLPMIFDDSEVGERWYVLDFYSTVSPDAALRDASNEASSALSDCSTELTMREDVFKLIDSVYKSRNTTGAKLDAESMRLLEKTYQDYIFSGLGIPVGPKRDRFKEIDLRLSDLGTDYNTNLNEEVGGVWLTREELAGVPDYAVERLKQGTAAEGTEGKLWLTWKYPDTGPFFDYATNPDARRKVSILYANRVAQNEPILREAILLRDERARLLGYKTHAEYRLVNRMAKNPETVWNFLNDLRSRTTEPGAKELQVLLDLKKKDYEARNLSFDGRFYSWDSSFYQRILVEDEYSIDPVKISEYFALEPTLEVIFQTFSDLLGFVFVLLKPEDQAKISPGGPMVWQKDVIPYAVWDTESFGPDDDGFRGYLLLDLHPRPGKYGHAATFTNQVGYLTKEGKQVMPTYSLVCNLNPPTADKPSLLDHGEVLTIFHELGHAMHGLSARSRYQRFSGFSVARDFIEAPSQMLENWFWTPSVLKATSKHYKTGERMPDDMIEKLISTKKVNRAQGALGQLRLGIFDMMMHDPKSREELEKLDLASTWTLLGRNLTGIMTADVYDPKTYNSSWSHSEASISHYMGGYDAGYYGYLWSEVYSLDMFYTKFKADPSNKAEGRRYRHMVLEKGGTMDEFDILEAYLGRPPSTEAFYQELSG